ncbi:hypothetical protein GGR55DRAFT_452263 [Xylaria sp. FL0064]|nr:hypothetical protein GGR55DRAFT_452263 [Xylaria sp. FL0064]
MILGMTSLVAKTMNMPDVRSIQETLNIIQTEVKNDANIKALTLYEIKDDIERTATKLQEEIQESVKNGNEAKVAAREAAQNSHQGHQIHKTDADPRAIQGQETNRRSLALGGD